MGDQVISIIYRKQDDNEKIKGKRKENKGKKGISKSKK